MDDQKKEEERLSLPLPGKDLILLHFYLGGGLLCLYQACPLGAEWQKIFNNLGKNSEYKLTTPEVIGGSVCVFLGLSL